MLNADTKLSELARRALTIVAKAGNTLFYLVEVKPDSPQNSFGDDFDFLLK